MPTALQSGLCPFPERSLRKGRVHWPCLPGWKKRPRKHFRFGNEVRGVALMLRSETLTTNPWLPMSKDVTVTEKASSTALSLMIDQNYRLVNLKVP